MSDPLTNLEIQDVLSSIRRLVSEDNRHRADRERSRETAYGAQDAAPADAPVGAAAEPGKLFLTEALRVAVPEDAAPEEVVPQPAEPQLAELETGMQDAAEDTQVAEMASEPEAELADAVPLDLDETVTGDARFEAENALPAVAEAEAAGDDTWEPVDDEGSLEGTIAELEAAVAGIGGEFEPDGSEVVRGDAIDAELEEAFEESFPVDMAAEDEVALLSQPVTADAAERTPAAAPWAEDESVAEDDVSPVSDAPAASAAAAASEMEAPETDDMLADEMLADDAPADDATHAADGADVPADHFDLAGAPGPEAGGDTEGEGEGNLAEDVMPAFVHSGAVLSFAGLMTGDEAPRALGARRLTLTAAEAVSESTAPWDRADATAVVPEGDTEPDTGPSDAPGLASALADDMDVPAQVGDDEGSIFGPGEEGVIDMEMLRDLVAEIIREELQGPLGERITRNVRMLVRREINRALEGRGLE